MSKLQALLKEKKMTQKELSEKSGFNKDYVNRVIKGHHDMTLKRAKIIAAILEVRIDDLV